VYNRPVLEKPAFRSFGAMHDGWSATEREIAPFRTFAFGAAGLSSYPKEGIAYA